MCAHESVEANMNKYVLSTERKYSDTVMNGTHEGLLFVVGDHLHNPLGNKR